MLGYTPWTQRRELLITSARSLDSGPSFGITCRPMNTFYLFKIYEVDERTIRQRIGFLAEAFEIQELIGDAGAQVVAGPTDAL